MSEQTPIERFWALPIYPHEETIMATLENLQALKKEFPDEAARMKPGSALIRRLAPNAVYIANQGDDIYAAVDEKGILWGRCMGCRQRILFP